MGFIKQTILFFLLCITVKSNGQEILSLPQITATTIQSLDVPTAPKNHCISAVIKDAQGRLWMKSCGVAGHLYALKFLQFDGYNMRPISIAGEKWNGPTNTELFGETETLGILGCLNRHPLQSTLFSYNYKKDSVNYFPIKKGIVGGVIEHQKDQYWVLVKTENSYIIYDWAGEEFNFFAEIPDDTHFNKKLQQFHSKEQSSFFYDGKDIWIYDKRLPLIQFNVSTKKVSKYGSERFKGLNKEEQNQLNWNGPRSKAIERDGKIYLLTHFPKGSFFVFDKKRKEFEKIDMLSENWEGYNMLKDDAGNILFLFNKNKEDEGGILLDKNNKRYNYSPVLKDLAQIRSVTSTDLKKDAIFSTNKGAVFVSCSKKKAIKNKFKGKSVRYIYELGKDSFLINNNQGLSLLINDNIEELSGYSCLEELKEQRGARQILTDHKGNTWLRGSKGLFQFKSNLSGECNYHEIGFTSRTNVFLPSGKFLTLQERDLWIYDLEEKKLAPFLVQGKPLSLPSIAHYMLVTEDRYLWFGTNVGLYKVDLQLDKLTVYGQNTALQNHRIIVMAEDKNGKVWLGTANNGIIIFDPETGKIIKTLNKAKGLNDNLVVNILKDDENDLWVGTYDGISLVDTDGTILANLNMEDGLIHYECNRYSHFKSSDGRIFIGTVNGLNIIDPAAIKNELKQSEKAKIFISSLSYFKDGEEINIKNVDAPFPDIHLQAAERNLAVNIAMSNYGYREKNRFAYRLEGINKDWIYLEDENRIRLFNLPSGDYNLIINGIDQNGNWAENPIRLKIYAAEFFYKQTWFYLLCALPFVLFGILWIQRLKKQKLILETKVNERTFQIAKDKELIEQQANELQQLDKMKSRFFANISHDLRTPITLIKGPADVLSEDEDLQQNPKAIKSINSISKNSKKLLSLVDELLDLAKIESQKIQLHEAPFLLKNYCQQLFESFQTEAQRKHIQYQLDYQLDEDFVLISDAKRLDKILQNLLSNAFKFTPNGGAIKWTLSRNEQQLIFEIKDSGRGISKDDLPHIFDRFFQSKNEALIHSSGSGIGLSLSKELAKLLNGNLEVESQFGKGSAFTLSIPVKEGVLEQTSIPKQQKLKRPSYYLSDQSSKKLDATIMIIEDNLEVQSFVNDLLSDSYKTIIFDDGQQALNYLEVSKNGPPIIDLILSDINMPNLDGYELAKILKEDKKWSTIPLIMLTAKTEEQDKIQALRLGVDDYICKPFSPIELKLRISNALDNYNKRKVYQKELHEVNFDFEKTISADQQWLKDLEENAKEALNKEINLTAGFLSSTMAIGERQLARKVKLLTGMTVGKYIVEVKLQKARHLLESKAFNSVAEVSFQCGFSSPSYFAKIYRENFGKNPSTYLSSHS